MSTVQTIRRAEKPASRALRHSRAAVPAPRVLAATRWPREYRPQSPHDQLRREVDELRGRINDYGVFFRAIASLEDNRATPAASATRPEFTLYQGGAA